MSRKRTPPSPRNPLGSRPDLDALWHHICGGEVGDDGSLLPMGEPRPATPEQIAAERERERVAQSMTCDVIKAGQEAARRADVRLKRPEGATPATCSASPTCAGELMITVFRDERLWYEGTAAQLIDEGLIPKGFEWPQARARKEWAANGFEYSLRRARPKDHKGPLRSWMEADNWCLHVWVAGRDYHRWRAERKLERKAEEVEGERYRLTSAGQRAWARYRRQIIDASSDPAFDRFKLLVPGLVPPKRGRKPKAAQDHGHGAPQHDRSASAG